mgnify:CR=1 FL=1
MRLVRPFLKVLQEHPAIPYELIRPLAENDADERLPVSRRQWPVVRQALGL